jgi:antitoxin component of MazEF toxin-antitoxin module
MQKNSGPIISVVEVDPIDGSYVIKLPESVVNELEWYDGTEVVVSLDGNELIVTDLETYEDF